MNANIKNSDRMIRLRAMFLEPLFPANRGDWFEKILARWRDFGVSNSFVLLLEASFNSMKKIDLGYVI